jgi:dihydrodipicolinate synthase/N-acetylneuraminate lyase
MKNPIFKGIGTALVTPMTEAGQVDYAAVERLVDYQLQGTGLSGTQGAWIAVDLTNSITSGVQSVTELSECTSSMNNYRDYSY